MSLLTETSKTFSSNGEISIIKVLNDIATDETLSDPVFVGDAIGVTLLVDAQASVSGGVVELEAAPTADYAGTWRQLGTVTTNAASKIFSCSIGMGNDNSGAGLPQMYVRAHISTVISGGTVDVYIIKRK